MSLRTTLSAVALSTTLVAGATALAPTSSAVPDDGRLPTDAVVFRPSAADLARPAVDHAPLDARTLDADRRGDVGNLIDVAFVYPAALVSQADIGGIDGLRAKFAKAIADANTAFTNSGIPVQLRNVGDRQVAAPTSKDVFAMHKFLVVPGDGVYEEAQALREETHADLVSLWASGSVPLGDSCGIGSLGGSQGKNDPEYSAWTMTFYTDCEDRFYVFTHEIGHNLSADHDTSAKAPPMGGKLYARGLTDPAHKFITMMAYWEGCEQAGVNDCSRIPYFSGPNVRTAQGHPTGNAAADNVRAITEQAPIVANYRQSQIYGAAPTISGTPNRGGTLVANTAGWAPGNVTFTHQWFANGQPIAGATADRFRPTKAQVGTTITVTVTGSAPYYAPVSIGSAPSGTIGKQLFKRAPAPKIRGAARVGGKLTAVVKSWKPGKRVKYAFTWFRNGSAIKGASGRTYRVKRKDRGDKLWVQVTGKRNGFEALSKTSKKVKVRR